MTEYGSKSIKVLEGLEPVRLRPGMYIGTTDESGLHHLIWEVIDNSIDEAGMGFANTVTVTINKDGSISIEDNGRGMPVDMHPSGMPGVQVIFTTLHAGGKFDHDSYDYSAGLHGVGASVVNALSEWLTVEVYRNKKAYQIEFHSPRTKKGVLSGVLKTPLKEMGKTNKQGSKVTFMPDKDVFDTVIFDADRIETKLREYAFLNKGLLIRFCDERQEESEMVEFRFSNGLVDFVEYINDGVEESKSKIIAFEGAKNGVKLELAVQYVNTYTDTLNSFVNCVKTTEGGYHETGFKAALTKSFNDYARQSNLLKPKDANLTGDDFREGMVAVIAVKMQSPQFEGQTKAKLGNQDVRPIVESIVSEQLEQFLSLSKNKATADFIVKHAIDAARTREVARRATQAQRDKNAINGATLVGKFAACISKDSSQCELFIVEGDSAGGSAKQGRDRRTQAVLPLRGKPLNVLRVAKRENIYKNEEIRTIIAAIGTGVESDFNINDLRFDKIIILSDADYDGYHIRCLLLVLFNSLMKDLIMQGKVYVGMPPLYKVEKRGVIKYAYNDEELEQLVEEMKPGKGDIQRYKGLGEMSKEQLWDTTLNPKTRMLTRVTLDEVREADEIINTLMNEGTERRKAYIYRHAKFNKVDSFAQKYGG